MSIQKLHWLVKERYNKLDSNHYRDLTPMELDQAIQDGTFQFIERVALIEDQPRFDMIANLLIVAPEQGALTPMTSENDVYQFDLDELEYDYYHYKRAYVNTDCGLVKVELIGSGRLSDVLLDQFSKPSRKWRRLVGTIAKNSERDSFSLYVYSEPGFTVDSLYLEYIRQPAKVFYGGYDTIEYLECVAAGNSDCSAYYSASSDPVDSDIDETYHTLIADYAVRELSRILKDVQSFQLQTEKTNSLT